MLTFKSVGEYVLIFNGYVDDYMGYDEVVRALTVIDNIRDNILATYGIDISTRTYDVSDTPENMLRTHYQCVRDVLIGRREKLMCSKYMDHSGT